jgi:hypothetical protein
VNFTNSYIAEKKKKRAENKTTTQETHEPTEKNLLLLGSQDVS